MVPHFEKMLYDNALLLGVYARSGTALGRRVAEETADFLIRELGTAEGGFAAALDADSEGEEGRFYVWTPAQLVEVLGEDDGRWAAALLEVTESGTFEHGSSTLQLLADPDDAARWDDVRHRLMDARDGRVRPARDDKVVAAWNGLAIASLSDAGRLLGREDLVDAALRAGTLLAELHLRDDGSLLRVSRDGHAGRHRGVLEDHGCVAHGFLALAGATGDARVARPGAVGARPRPRPVPRRRRRVLRHGLRRRGAGRPAARPVRRRQPVRYVGDGARARRGGLDDRRGPLPPGRRGGAEHGRRPWRCRRRGSPAGRSRPPRPWPPARSRSPSSVLPVRRATSSSGPPAARPVSPSWSPTRGADPSSGGIPLLIARGPVGGDPAAYVCREMVCERPVTTPSDLLALLGG